MGGANSHRRRLVVIGNGMAGARLVEEVLSLGGGELFQITVIGDEPYGNYNRIMLSHVLDGSQDEADIFLNPLDWYADHGVRLMSGVRARQIDRFAKVVLTEDGSRVPYDTLVIATGSRAYIPPMDGIATVDGSWLPGVFTCRTLDDTRAILAYAAAGGSRAVVLGGGLLGLEAAAGLRDRGLRVDLVHSRGTLMNAQLGPAGGTALRRQVERLGITVRTENRIQAIRGRDRVTGVRLKDNSVLDCDIVVISAGIRPNADLATVSGLNVQRGIVVDETLATEDPHIYAVGECAQFRGEVYGLVGPAWEQAGIVARRLTENDPQAAFSGTRVATKLKVAGIDVAAMGASGPEYDADEEIIYSDPKAAIYKSVVIRDDKVVGATLVGDANKVAFLQESYERGLPLPEERATLLFELGAPDDADDLATLAEEAQVCNCNGVSKGQIVASVAGGRRSLGAVMDDTRAGKGCGSCKELVAKIVEWAAGGDLSEDPSAHWYVPGIPLAKPELMQAIREHRLRSVSAVFAALAPEGAEDAKSKMGLAALLKMMWADDYIDERDARFINDRVHANIQKDGTFSVVPQMRGGVTSPDQLRRIADVADKYQIPMV